MKKLAGLVIIIAILVLGSYFGLGYLTEQKLKEVLNVVNQSSGVSAKVENYKRGWFTSKALIDWTLRIPERIITPAGGGLSRTLPAEEYQLPMPLNIYHGPVIFADNSVKLGLGYAKTDLSLPPKYLEEFNKVFSADSTKPKLDMSILVSYLNNTSINISVPKFKLIAEKFGQFDWLGMTSTTNVSSNLDKVDGNLTIDGISLAKDHLKTTMSPITSEFNLHKSDTGLYLGDASLSFPSLVVTNNAQKLFELDQLNVYSSSNIEEGLFGAHFKTTIEKIITEGKTYGPGKLQVAIRNLDANVLARMNEQLKQVQQGGSDTERQKATLALIPELPKLFAKGAEFAISELNFGMPQGTIEGSLLVSMPKGEVLNPFELIQKIQGRGKLKLPIVVFKDLLTESIRQKMLASQLPQSIQQGLVQQMQQTNQPPTPGKAGATSGQKAISPPLSPANVVKQAEALAENQLASMVQAGILKVQGNDYVIDVSLNQGQLMVNDKPINPTKVKMQ
jgi:uncharacterized protein YdgA (DUF945 family)